MPFKGNDFQTDRGEGYAAITSGLYGSEHDDNMDGLVDLENGVRKYWADQLQKLIDSEHPAVSPEKAGMLRLVALLDPYSGNDGDDGQFARTTLDDRPEGAKWVTPNDED